MVQGISFTTGSDGKKKKNPICKLQKCLLSESEIHNLNIFSIQKVQLLQHLYTCSSNIKELPKLTKYKKTKYISTNTWNKSLKIKAL